MKKKIIIITLIIITTISIVSILIYQKYENNKIDIKLVTNKEVEVYNNVKVSDFIENKDNIEIIDDYIVNTDKIGTETVFFQYKHNGFKYKDSFDIKVVDKTNPTILINKTYTITKDSDIDLTNSILCGDNYTDAPNCYIEGEYDINKVGDYKLKYIGIDSSNNKTVKDFVLKVIEPKNNNDNANPPVTTPFQDIISTYKKDNTSIGIDVSKWQGDIDFKKVKDSGAEFVIIKVAGEKTLDSGIEIDPYFKNNIENALNNNLQVGVYYNSKANSLEDAKKEANFVLDAIKDYDVSLGVAYDWESWSAFNNYKVSFHTLNQIATTFLDTIQEKGYNPILYGSEYYLNLIWNLDKYDTWLANYSKNINYNKPYIMWQLCNNGRIDGINGNVDIDVLYK